MTSSSKEGSRILFRVDRFFARRLYPENLPLIELLNKQCSDAFLFQNGTLPTEAEAREAFDQFPPGCCAEDKLVIGLFDEQSQLVGMFEILQGYRKPDEWYIGLALVAPEERGKGLGALAHVALADYARSFKVKKLVLAVLEGNQRARKFWLRLGYRKTKDYPTRQIGERAHALAEFEFDLQDARNCPIPQ
jgi:RimJ/RimL family protein N-acetyltransferase